MSDLVHVTDVLRRAGLVDASWFTEEARDRGTAVHMAAHYLDEGDLDWESLDPSVVPRVRQYQHFLEEVRPEMLAIEEPVSNEALQYCGRLDRRVKINGRECIVDFKGPSEAAWNGIQLAGYAGCFTRPLGRFNLYLSDERYRLVERKERSDWDVFKVALVLAAWKEKHGT